MTNVSSDSTSSSSPRLRRGGKNLPSPWATIVRGEPESNPPPPATVSPSKGISSSKEAAEKEVVVVVDSESSPPPPTPKVSSETVVVEEMVREESPDHGNEKAKKPAWNKPSNGAVEVGNVMGASSWPALSESAKASPKSSSDSLKNLSDGSTAVTQGPVIASVPQKQVNVNANPSSTPNHQFLIRQKSFKRGGGGGGTGSGSGSGSGTGGSAANGGGVSYVQPPPPPPPPPMVDVHRSGRPGPLFPPVLPNSSPRDPHHKNHNWENGPRGSQSHIGGNDHSHQRNFRRGSNGPHPRGDGSNHRRDQDRGNHDWHPHRGFGGRDLHVQHRGVPRNFIRGPPPPPSPVPFIPPAVRPFGNHMGYPDIQQMYIYQFQAPESFRGVPIVHSAPIMLVPGSHDPNMLAPDLNFPSILMKQIDYYFSPDNLCKDRFLRGHMDEQGWVPVNLIATFPRRFRGILHEGEIDKRVQFLIEGLFAIRKAKFQGYPAVRKELDLVEQEDQLTHEVSLEDDIDAEIALDIFKPDPQFAENEKRYEELKRNILGDESCEDEAEAGSDEVSDDEDEDETDEEEEEEEQMKIKDETETNLVNLRRTIYLTIMSSVDFEEAGHKLLKIKLEPGQEMELCIMLLECCSQERTYLRYYGLLGQRFCMINKVYQENFDKCFVHQYSMIHRLETNKLRNVAKFFAHLLGTDALPWHVLAYIRLTEEDTTSSSRIFIKILFQELSEHLGIRLLNERLTDPAMQDSFESIFPKDNPKNTRFSINFFTSIGLGGITENLREYLKNMPRLIMQQQKTMSESDDESGSSSSATSDGSSSESESDSSEDSRSHKKRLKRRD